VTPTVRRLLALVLAVGLALAGALGVLAYARGADQRAIADQSPTTVLIVTRDIPRGTPASDIVASVRSAVVPAVASARGAVTDLAQIAGRVAAVDLVPGEQLLRGRFIDVDELDPADETLVPEGLQEIAFLLPMDRVVGGRLTPGDLVAVFVTFDGGITTTAAEDAVPLALRTVTSLLTDRLLVTAVQYTTAPTATTGAPEVVPAGDLLVTFAVDTLTAERLTHAFDQGRVRLTLLNADTRQSEPTTITRENILD
jgi:pilus assembly protein CpaB